MIARPPRVAVVGRQNVGKSTLVNRLFGRREAISDATPGVTRDRLEVETTWRGRRFGLVDTGGFARRARGIEALVARQAERAAEQADVVLVVVDGQTGIREEDELLARRLRKTSVPVLVVVNKVDSVKEEPDAEGFRRLGLGEPMVVSALHGRGAGELLDRIVALLPEASPEPEIEREPRFAVVGRPNVGKSSLFNRLAGEERSVVYEEAGTTRDSVDAVIHWPAGPVRFVDTAGLRRSTKARGVEYYSFVRAVKAIDRAHVVAVVLDAVDGFTSEDKRIAARVMAAGRALLLVANKWDLVDEKDRTFKQLQGQLGPFSRAQVLRASALRGSGVHRLPPILTELHERWSKRVPTSVVNRIVREAQDERPAPRGTSRYRYATQVAAGPPTFVLFGGRAPDPAYRRFLEGRLRGHLGFDGVPVRLMFRPKRPRAAPGDRRASPKG